TVGAILIFCHPFHGHESLKMKREENVTNVLPSSNIAPFPFLAPILTHLRLFMEMINYCLQLKN
ncbi:hypothetical protein CWN39_31285, partial [Klebsiella pneumoniae]